MNKTLARCPNCNTVQRPVSTIGPMASLKTCTCSSCGHYYRPQPVTFEAWKNSVNAEVVRRIGVDVDDLPDLCNLAQWFQDNMEPVRAAVRVVKACKPGNW